MKKNIIACSLLSAFICLLAACSGPHTSGEGFGYISISLAGGTARAVSWPPAGDLWRNIEHTIVVEKYEDTSYTTPAAAAVEHILPPGTTSKSIELEPGFYAISVSATWDGEPYAECTAPVRATIVSGQTTPVRVVMTKITTGTPPPDYYITISTADELAKIGHADYLDDYPLSGNYLLANEIDLENIPWTPIGTDDTTPFTGTFDGNGKKISGLYINATTNDTDADYKGLFGVVDVVGSDGGVVRNLTVEGSVTGYNTVGGIVGQNNGTLEYCASSVNVTGNSIVGGLVGKNEGTVSNCYVTGNIKYGNSGNAGGVVGSNGGEVSNCYATGNVTSSSGTFIGGIAGNNDSTGTVQYCVALNGIVSGGRVVGNDYGGTLEDNYADEDMKDENEDTLLQGTATDENGEDVSLATASTQDFWENIMGWDFDEVWQWDYDRSLPALRNMP